MYALLSIINLQNCNKIHAPIFSGIFRFTSRRQATRRRNGVTLPRTKRHPHIRHLIPRYFRRKHPHHEITTGTSGQNKSTAHGQFHKKDCAHHAPPPRSPQSTFTHQNHDPTESHRFGRI